MSVRPAATLDTSNVMSVTAQGGKKPQAGRARRGDSLPKSSHSIPETAKNSGVRYLLNEYVRVDRDRNILVDHWFSGMSFYQISEKYKISLTAVKKIVYGIGDKILLKLD